MTALVTGGAGYIGSHVVYELIRDGHDVIVLDDLSTGNKEAVHHQAKLYIGDQKDVQLLKKIFTQHKIDVVMHFSAKLIVPESVKKPIEYFENNVHGLAVLLAAMRDHHVHNIVFSSTAAVYGQPNKVPISEDDNKLPMSPYGTSKLACEWLIQGAAKAYQINYVIFRYFNVAGADASGAIGQATKGKALTHLIPVVIETALKLRKSISVFGNDYDTSDGTCVRDYIHVSDLARAHVSGALYALKGKSNIFNLGSQRGFSVAEVIACAQKTLHLKVPYEIKKRRSGDPAALVATNALALKEINFKINYSLEQMIASDFQWRKHKKF